MIYKRFIKEALEESATIAKKYFGKVSGTTKSYDNNQVLTEADLAIGKHLIRKIKENYPEYNIIDEETGAINNASDYTWVVDPIDGTSNFANGVPTYGTIIGLLEKDTPIAGGIVLPYFDQTLIAEKGKGTLCNGRKVQVTKETRLLSTLLAYSIDSHIENPALTREEVKLLGEIILHIRNLRASGSIYDILQVVKGNYAGYLCRTSKIWDSVGTHIIVEEAGGIYTDFFGKPMNYSDPLHKIDDNYTFCAASPALHKQLQEIIHQ